MLEGSSYFIRGKCIYKFTICVIVSLTFYSFFNYKTVIQSNENNPQVSNRETGKSLNLYLNTTSKTIIDPFRQSVFQKIYNRKLWGNYGKGSGLGSAIQYTVILRKRLQQFISIYNLSSMADIPCGAMEWTEVFLKSVWEMKPFFAYTGMDITESVVKQLQEKWKGYSRVTIRLADLVSALPHISADFILTRDALQHMPLKDACLGIENLISLGYYVKYVLIGTYPKSLININIKSGEYHSVNVMEKPFNLPKPHLVFKEIQDTDQKYVYVFKMKDLQQHRCKICSEYVKRNGCP